MFKDICANIRMVFGVLSLISLTACSSTPYYGEVSTARTYAHPGSSISILYNWGKYTAYSVPAQDRAEHERCIYFALDHLPAGESCQWYSKTNSARGEVRVQVVKPNTCTILYSTIWYKGNPKSFREEACLSGKYWKFVQG
jgi:hypothetical protein